MNVFIPTKEELDDTIYRAVKKVILEELPGAILKVGEYYRVADYERSYEDATMLTPARTIPERDSNQLTFYQNGHTIRYRVEEVEAFLNGSRVEAYI